MSKESEDSAQEITARWTHVSKVIAERETVYGDVGHGTIDPFSSLENAVKIGRVKSKLAKNIRALKLKQADLEEQRINFFKAQKLAKEKEDRLAKLEELEKYTNDGHVDPTVLQHYRVEFREFMNSIESDPIVAKVISEYALGQLNRSENAGKAMCELHMFIENLDENKYPEQKGYRNWVRRWDEEYGKYGEDSLITFFPREFKKDRNLVVRTLNSLVRTGIHTRVQLEELTIEELESIRNFGEKSMELAIMLRNVISEQTKSGSRD